MADKKKQTLRAHPVAECFPPLTDQEYGDLLADVREFGVRVPIVVTAQGEIVDGLHRWRAAQETGQPCPQEPLPDGQNPWQTALALNVKRRQLNESQRAMVSARLSQASKVGKPSKSANLPNIGEAAQMLSVSERSTRTARKIVEQGSAELVAAVDAGEVKVSDAVAVVEAPKKAQNAALKMVRSGEVRTLRAAMKQAEPAPEPAAEPVAEIEPEPADTEPETTAGEAAVEIVTEPEPAPVKASGGGRSRELIVEAIGQAQALEKVLKRLCGGQVRKQIITALDAHLAAQGVEGDAGETWLDGNICFYLQPGDGIQDVLTSLLEMFDAGRERN